MSKLEKTGLMVFIIGMILLPSTQQEGSKFFFAFALLLIGGFLFLIAEEK